MTDQSPGCSDTESALRSSVARTIDRHWSPTAALGTGDIPFVADGLWESLSVDLGLAGLLIPESHGGAGASAREAAVVVEELGRTVAPVPFLTSAVFATRVALEAGDDRLVSCLASGATTAAVAAPLSHGPKEICVPTVTFASGRLSGHVSSVAGVSTGSVLVVPARHHGALELFRVDVDDIVVTAVDSLDLTRPLVDLTLDRVDGERIASGTSAESALLSGHRSACSLLASEQYGVAKWCLDTTVAYLSQRVQFGRALGGFQAIKHRLANIYVQVQAAQAAARHAAAVEPRDASESAIAAAVAQSFCSDVAVDVAEEAVQLHGGVGMTWDYPLHLYLKRAKTDQLAWGSPADHRHALSALVDLHLDGRA